MYLASCIYIYLSVCLCNWAAHVAQLVKNPPAMPEIDLCSIPGLGRSPGEQPGSQLQYSCLENPMDRGAWRATVHGVTKSQTQLSNLAQHNIHGTIHLYLYLFTEIYLFISIFTSLSLSIYILVSIYHLAVISSILFCFLGEIIFYLPKALIIIRDEFFNQLSWRIDSRDAKQRSLKR